MSPHAKFLWLTVALGLLPAASARLVGFNRDRSADEAELFCQGRGGHLATIPDEVTNGDALNAAIDAGMWKFWIGAQRVGPGATIDSFRNRDGSPLAFVNWLSGEPNNNRNRENCVLVGHSSAPDEPVWNDAKCDKRLGFVCTLPDEDTTGDEWSGDEEIAVSTTAPTPAPTLPACEDLDEEWLDRDNDGCEVYSSQGWCANRGVGPVWQAGMDFAFFASADGRHAGQICCSCGGGSLANGGVSTALPEDQVTVTVTAPATPSTGQDTSPRPCNDLEAPVARWRVPAADAPPMDPRIAAMFQQLTNVGRVIGNMPLVTNDVEPTIGRHWRVAARPVQLSCEDVCSETAVGYGCYPCPLAQNASCVRLGPFGSGELCRTEWDGEVKPCCEGSNATCAMPRNCPPCAELGLPLSIPARLATHNNDVPTCNGSFVIKARPCPTTPEEPIALRQMKARLLAVGTMLGDLRVYPKTVAALQLNCDAVCADLEFGAGCHPCPASFHSTMEDCLAGGPFGSGKLCREHVPINDTVAVTVACCSDTEGQQGNCAREQQRCNCEGTPGSSGISLRAAQFDAETSTCTYE